MSVAREHAEWLSLLDISGPFLSLPVLQRTFPQGIEAIPTGLRGDLRAAYSQWLDERADDPTLHPKWVRWILTGVLGHDAALIAEGPRIPAGLDRLVAEHHETLRPDLVLLSPHDGKPALLIQIHAPAQDLTKPLSGAQWKASPDTRMAELLRGTGVPLGLITNGERWMLVHAPPKETAGYTSWYADLWLQEPLTFRAFVALLRAGRFFGVAEKETLPALLRDSAQDQAEVTDQLGAQVRAAVQVLVQAFDKLDGASNRALLAGVDERALYEAALTVMMRLVFLLSAEERKLIGNEYETYQRNYAVGGVLDELQARADRHGEEILERNSDAWCRLLAVFRAVHGGVQHENVRLPAYGGTLFDPDRFPFLEGRAAQTKWTTHPAHPLAVNNRVVLHLLRALQFIETKLPGGGDIAARRLSFRGLDIEQIGHVYEGLLDHTARRAGQVILGLAASKGRIATLPLERLEALAAESQEKLIEFLVEETERTESSLRNVLDAGGEKPRRGRKAAAPELDLLKAAEAPAAYHVIPHAITAACDHDPALAARIAPYAGLLRADTFARPLVILPDSLYVAPGSDRRSTGTHYTPRSLTEPIVQHTLEPLVYHGPAEGLPRGEWRLKTPREILALKICDLAMGSGAFLVGVCRYLSARLVEAWAEVERAHPDAFITSPEGDLSTGDPSEALIARLPDDERLHLAARAIADRCLYGVDINPMAVEMAKLSLWLITVDRERPFTFLDHALKCGDSLLGVSDARQLERFSLRPADDAQPLFDTANLWRHVQQAATLRRQLEATPSHTAAQLVEKARLHGDAETLLARLRAAADFLLAAELDSPGDRGWDTRRAIAASHMQAGWKKDIAEFQHLARAELRGRRPFHWPLEFPEVFDAGENGERPAGFDAFVGNPPFIKGHFISQHFGDDYRAYLARNIHGDKAGLADVCSFFLARIYGFLRSTGAAGVIATNTISEGDTRKVGLDSICQLGGTIILADPDITWPGDASVVISPVIVTRKAWSGAALLSGREVDSISSRLQEGAQHEVLPLLANDRIAFVGSYLLGDGYILTHSEAQEFLSSVPGAEEVILPYLNGIEFNAFPDLKPKRLAICFWDWSLERARTFGPLFERVERLVKPDRDVVDRDRNRENWWLHAENRPGLYHAVGLGNRFESHPKDWLRTASHPSRVIAKAKTSDTWAFGFLPSTALFDQTLTIIARDDCGMFVSLQSTLHEIWARESGAGSKMKLDQRYSASMFATFPFPTDMRGMEAVGERYHEHRRQLMQARGEGLTKTYNRFHDPGETAADIGELRTLHHHLDTAVAAAYGWPDLAAHEGTALGHDFHETKQGTRYTLAP
ncbi:MAG: restriction endonuclease, partial [Chthoniobacteraceae bacterium]